MGLVIFRYPQWLLEALELTVSLGVTLSAYEVPKHYRSLHVSSTESRFAKSDDSLLCRKAPDEVAERFLYFFVPFFAISRRGSAADEPVAGATGRFRIGEGGARLWLEGP